MGSRKSVKRSLLLSAVFAATVFSGVALAQNNKDTSTTANGATTSTTAEGTTTSPTTVGQTTAVITNTNTDNNNTPSSSAPLPTITGTAAPSTDTGKLTGLPTLSKTLNNVVPTYPPPSPPPTQNAPFMNHSTLPDGTVFIAVGAILGAFGVAILAWRGILACLLHRSVERAAMAQAVANDKMASFPAPPAPFYKYTDHNSSHSLPLGAAVAGRGQRRTTRGPTPSATPSQTNLFFSPTAAGGASGGMGGGSNRDSRFLPSGFYASSSVSPMPGGDGGLRGHGHSSSHGQSINMSNLRPASSRGPLLPGAGGGGTMDRTPPESPNVGPAIGRGTPGSRNFSTSSVNLNRPPSGRAPSAYLDDLLDEQGGQWPPAPPPPGGGHYYPQGQSPSPQQQQGRY